MNNHTNQAAMFVVGSPQFSAGCGNLDPMKYSNGDVRLDDAVERNGGHIVISNMNLLFDTSW